MSKGSHKWHTGQYVTCSVSSVLYKPNWCKILSCVSLQMRNRKTVIQKLMWRHVVMFCHSHVNCTWLNMWCITTPIWALTHLASLCLAHPATYKKNAHGRFLPSLTLMGWHLFMRMNHRHQSIIRGSCLFIYMAVYRERGTQTPRERESQ